MTSSRINQLARSEFSDDIKSFKCSQLPGNFFFPPKAIINLLIQQTYCQNSLKKFSKNKFVQSTQLSFRHIWHNNWNVKNIFRFFITLICFFSAVFFYIKYFHESRLHQNVYKRNRFHQKETINSLFGWFKVCVCLNRRYRWIEILLVCWNNLKLTLGIFFGGSCFWDFLMFFDLLTVVWWIMGSYENSYVWVCSKKCFDFDRTRYSSWKILIFASIQTLFLFFSIERSNN